MTVTTAFTSSFRTFFSLVSLFLLGFGVLTSEAENPSFHNAPGAAQREKNPYAGQSQALLAGRVIYTSNCATCHGATGEGSGNVPPLTNGNAQSATDGEVFWYITHGDAANGMPSWAGLPL
jgi:mono/diheme cytochrome c family protein